MSARHPFGWDLPPGCTNADIDRNFGDPPLQTCKECGDDFEPEDDEAICSKCQKIEDQRANDSDTNKER